MKTKQNKVIEPEEDKYIKKTNQVVGTYNDAPDFIKDNEYIKRGYRVNCDSVKKVTKSLFYLHNESVNVWSHLLGVISTMKVLSP